VVAKHYFFWMGVGFVVFVVWGWFWFGFWWGLSWVICVLCFNEDGWLVSE